MGAATPAKQPQQRHATQPSSSKVVKKELFPLIDLPENPKPNFTACLSNLNPIPATADVAGDSEYVLCSTEFLTREEVLRRRSSRLKRLAAMYRDLYWASMEELKARHRHYYWQNGKSPIENENDGEEDIASDGDVKEMENGVGRNMCGSAVVKVGIKGKRPKCKFCGCKSYAMPVTRFCHSHILSDAKQTLYKPCKHVIKIAHSGQIICGKPVLRSAIPSLCSVHFQKVQKHVSQALKKAGLGASTSSRPASKLHVIIAECIRQIQAKRKKDLNVVDEKIS